jgi:hypothetical protein
MRINSSGNVGIGTTSPNGKLEVTAAAGSQTGVYLGNQTAGARTDLHVWSASNADGYIFFERSGASENGYIRYSQASDFMSFQTASAERMRLDTVGRLMIGTATARASASKLEMKSSANTELSIYMFKDTQVEVNMGFAGGSDSNFYINSGSTTIGASGVYLTNNGNSWSSVSDERMKTIVAPIENASAKVATLRTVMGYYNNDTTQTRRPFLIAQDVQAVLPEAVNVQDVKTGTLGMSYTDTIPLLVAAINELKAEFDAYKAAHP